MIGETEEAAKKKGIDYEVGRARYATTRAGRSSATSTAW